MKNFSLQTAVVCVFMLLGTTACQKHCQQQSNQSFRSVTETQWRLVETNDPSISANLDNFNFLIVQFGINNTGTVNRVVNNEMFQTPISSISWVPNAKNSTMRVRYTSIPAPKSDGTTAQVQQGDLGTFDYNYDLGRDLEMQEVQTGNYYRYVPYTGVVNPDSDCRF